VARGGDGKQAGTPEALPPERRTVGQLVAESMRVYGRRVWPSLAIGMPPAALSIAAARLARDEWLVVVATLGSVLLTVSYVVAVWIVTGASLRSRNAVVAYVVGVLVFVPFPLFAAFFILPGLAWLALFGLAVPAALVEGLGVRAAFARGFALGRADYVHALGSLATLFIVVLVTQFLAALLLQDFADNTARLAGFIAGVVVSPLLFLGAAILYEDQAARAARRPL
jgi:hypothetical protein